MRAGSVSVLTNICTLHSFPLSLGSRHGINKLGACIGLFLESGRLRTVVQNSTHVWPFHSARQLRTVLARLSWGYCSTGTPPPALPLYSPKWCGTCYRSQVRGAVMRVILASADRADDVDQECAQASNAEEETEEQQAADAASACMLWCSMAIGALVQGQPPTRVRCCSAFHKCKIFCGSE